MGKGIEGSFENPIKVKNFQELSKVNPGNFVTINRKEEFSEISICKDSVELVYNETDVNAVSSPVCSMSRVLTLSSRGRFIRQAHYEGIMSRFEPFFEVKYHKSNSFSQRYFKIFWDAKKQNVN